MRPLQLLILFLLVMLPIATVLADDVASAELTADMVNTADLATVPAEFVPPPGPDDTTGSDDAPPPPASPDPAIVKLQVLLDRAGASPGVIDGFDGDNVRKAVRALEVMRGLPEDGVVDEQVVLALDSAGPVVGAYEITAEDVAAIVPPIPSDYAEMAQRDFLGYASVEELLGERFHMDVDLLRALNPDAQFVAGEAVAVTAYGPDVADRKVTRIEADKTLRQVRAYDADGALVVAYPATIGSDDNPSPTGTHLVAAVAPMPNYTYNPDVNFQQGENTEKLIIPPGPNGPVGSMWIDLTEPTFGIHGTPEPSKIDKTASHGCVRLTNWDANELATLIEPGVPVEFVG